jgi:hypothetical protein
MYENLPFIFKKNYENWLYIKGYSNKKCDIGIFHTFMKQRQLQKGHTKNYQQCF